MDTVWLIITVTLVQCVYTSMHMQGCACVCTCVSMVCMVFGCTCGMWRLSYTSSPFIFLFTHSFIHGYTPFTFGFLIVSVVYTVCVWCGGFSTKWGYERQRQSHCSTLRSMTHTHRKCSVCACVFFQIYHSSNMSQTSRCCTGLRPLEGFGLWYHHILICVAHTATT